MEKWVGGKWKRFFYILKDGILNEWAERPIIKVIESFPIIYFVHFSLFFFETERFQVTRKYSSLWMYF